MGIGVKMDHSDDDVFASHLPPSSSKTVGIIAMVAGACIAGLLLWMNLSLSSQVKSLEEKIATLQKSLSVQALANTNNRLDSITQVLGEHLKSLSSEQPGAGASQSMKASTRATTPSSSEASPSSRVSHDLPPRQDQKGGASTTPDSNPSLPAPISSEDAASTQKPSSGGWAINISSVSDSGSALQEVTRLHNMGINAESVQATSNGKVWYRIRIPGFASHDEATAARPSIEKRLGIGGTWVTQKE